MQAHVQNTEVTRT